MRDFAKIGPRKMYSWQKYKVLIRDFAKLFCCYSNASLSIITR